MALAYEGNTSLAFDTEVLRKCGDRYARIATDLRNMARNLNNCLEQLKNSGWTTSAGTAFHEMVQTNWEENIKKYADLLDQLKNILDQASRDYDNLVFNHIDKTRV